VIEQVGRGRVAGTERHKSEQTRASCWKIEFPIFVAGFASSA
jgi:hypothetical protein